MSVRTYAALCSHLIAQGSADRSSFMRRDSNSLPTPGGAMGHDPLEYAMPSSVSTQERVLAFITAHPGIHLRKISRDLGLAIGDTQYQLSRLEKSGSIKSFRRGLYRFFFPADLFGERQGVIISVISQETPRELLLSILSKPGSSQEELSASLRLSPPTISWHMKRLLELGLVVRVQQGRHATYRPVSDSFEIAEFVRNYHPSVWARWSSRLTDIVLAMSTERVDVT